MFETNQTLHDAWVNGNIGKSSFGQGYTGAFQYFAHNQGMRDREAANSSSTSSSSPAYIPSTTYSTPTPSVGGGGGYSGFVPDRSMASESFLGFAFFVGLIVGFYDNVENKADLAHSATLAGGTVYAVADAIGTKIESAGSGALFGLAGGAVRWGITIPIGFTAGAGAFVGNFATDLGRCCPGCGWNLCDWPPGKMKVLHQAARSSG